MKLVAAPAARTMAIFTVSVAHVVIALSIALTACDARPTAPEAGSRCASPPHVCADDLVCLDGLCRNRPEAPAPLAPPEPPTATFDVIADTTDAAPVVERFLLGDFDENALADTRLSLAIGQAAAIELFLPFAAHPELLRLVAFRHAPGCGLFRPLLWAAHELDALPTVIGTAYPIQTRDDAPVVVELPFPELTQALDTGYYRVGARYEGPCTPSASAPYIAVDTSDDVTRTFVWANTWISGTDLSLPGRWAMALQVIRP